METCNRLPIPFPIPAWLNRLPTHSPRRSALTHSLPAPWLTLLAGPHRLTRFRFLVPLGTRVAMDPHSVVLFQPRDEIGDEFWCERGTSVGGATLLDRVVEMTFLE